MPGIRRMFQRHSQHAAGLLPRDIQTFLQVFQAFLQLKIRRKTSRLGMIVIMVHLSLPAVYGT